MQLWLTEEVVTVFTDSVQPSEDALVVNTFTLDFKKGALMKRMSDSQPRRTTC